MTNTDVAETTTGTADAVPKRMAFSLLHFAERYALLGLLVVVAVFFSVLPASSNVFPTAANIRILAAGQSVTLLIALAALIPLVAGYFDFSAGAVAASSSVTMAGMMANHNSPLWLCLVAAFALGLAVGLVNGVAVSVFGMNSFVITLATATLLGGAIQWYTQGQTISRNISSALIDFGSLTWAGIPRVLFVVVAAALAIYYILDQTPYGRSLRAIGDNRGAARLVGMPVARYGVLAFAAGGTLAALAGIVLTARTGGATADNGTSMIFPALAAVFLGATAVQPGHFNVFGTVIGVALVSTSVSGLTLAGAADWVNPVFNGAALAVAVAISTYLGRRSRTI
jgi:ribose transport system permease protein